MAFSLSILLGRTALLPAPLAAFLITALIAALITATVAGGLISTFVRIIVVNPHDRRHERLYYLGYHFVKNHPWFTTSFVKKNSGTPWNAGLSVT